MQERLRIVHLEDDPNDKLIVSSTLKQEGIDCDVVSVSTKSEFVAALEQGNVDLILSDYALPSFDGLAALALATRISPLAPFILVSGTMGEEAAIESLRGGATDYVLKSRLSRLAPAVRRAVKEATEQETRRATEVTLERERKFLLALLDSLEVGVVACDQNGMLTLFNRATRELHGMGEESIPPDQWASHYRLYHADGQTPLATEEIPLHRALMGERLRHAEIVIRHREGAAHTVAVSGQPIKGDGGGRLGAVVTMQDVTEHKQLERQFRQAQKMEAMGLLAAGVAHDFNNLLTVIGGYCQLAQSRIEPQHPIQRDLDEVSKAGQRAAALTRQLLAFSRQQVLQPRLLDLNGVIHEVEKMLRRLIGAGIELAVRCEEGLGQVRADEGQMEQVLLNLVVNARDAMSDEGRIAIETRNVQVGAGGMVAAREDERDPRALAEDDRSLVTAPDIPTGPYVMVEITDTGCGMDAETVSRIFEPFFTTKEVGRGTGLGLSTVHGIVSQSDGYITVQSAPGRGTAFRIFLPRALDAVGASIPETIPITPQRGSETILVVDDDTALLGLVCEVLRLHGYTVIEATNGNAALTLLENDRSRIDVLITDVVMPKMSGRELAERLERIRPNLPTLFMSGYVGEDIDTLGAILGSRIGFIQKPFVPDDLLAKLREVLDGAAGESNVSQEGATPRTGSPRTRKAGADRRSRRRQGSANVGSRK